MSEPFVGEIRMFAGNFAPRGWALCDGQLLAVSQNDTLFSLLGTTYGGDGSTTFGLPDLRGRVPVHAGTGPGLTPRNLGEKGGADSGSPANTAQVVSGVTIDRGVAVDTRTQPLVGVGKPLQPALCLSFIIALVGNYPSRD